MSALKCAIVKDLMPLYVEQLTTEETSEAICEHLETCESCQKDYTRMMQSVGIAVEPPKQDKKLLNYLNSVRWWYFLCPTIAFGTYLLGTPALFRVYIGLLTIFSAVCLSSYLSGMTSYGFDWDQVKIQEEAKEKELKRWGTYRVSPFYLCLPAILVILVHLCSRFDEIIRFFVDFF